jgi:hypothetical protein
MKTKFTDMPRKDITVNVGETLGQLCFRSHSFGLGGINALPIPDKIAAGIKALRPKLIRIFIQEFFRIYPGHDTYDWTKLDAYMDSVRAMGADIMAHITIKPEPLYPAVDETIWMPNDAAEWQRVIKALVNRYSVQKRYVTHWAVANEINIGEWGGCPYLFESPHDYYEYYKMTAEAVLSAYPEAKIGGPAWAGTGHDAEGFFETFLGLCKRDGLRADFLSYNQYQDDPRSQAEGARQFRRIADAYEPGLPVYITELNVNLEGCHEELAYEPGRAASLAATLLALNDTGALAGTFQYHIADMDCDPNDFAPFYARTRYMAHHWNDSPHRLGLFDWEGNPRPQYFLYRFLYGMSGERVAVKGDAYLHAAASRDGGRINILISNFCAFDVRDILCDIKLKNNPNGPYRLTVHRIDGEKRWDGDLSLRPAESRAVYMPEDFSFPVYAPGGSVTFIQLEKA